jgi:hypothetical protein
MWLNSGALFHGGFSLFEIHQDFRRNLDRGRLFSTLRCRLAVRAGFHHLTMRPRRLARDCTLTTSLPNRPRESLRSHESLIFWMLHAATWRNSSSNPFAPGKSSEVGKCPFQAVNQSFIFELGTNCNPQMPRFEPFKIRTKT